MRINKLVLVMFAAWLCIANCQLSQAQPATGGQAKSLHDIKNIARLKTLFNRQKGTTRLIVIFSPT